MKWLYKLFNAVPPSERKGISLTDAYWEVMPIDNIESLLLALPQLIPGNSILYLEGVTQRSKVKSFMDKNKILNNTNVAIGTLCPAPQRYHLIITEKSMRELSKIVKEYIPCEVAEHLHVYKDNNMLLQWFDAFTDDPIYLSKDISEEKLKEFCSKTATKYKPIKRAV